MRIRLTAIFLVFCCLNVFGTITPVSTPLPKDPPMFTLSAEAASRFAHMKIREIEKLSGRKLKLKEKLAIKVLQWKIKKGLVNNKQQASSKKGKTALIFGLIGSASLFIPYVSILALPCFILALIFGYQAKKADPGDRNAKTAIIIGWIGIALFVIAVLVVIAVLASWSGWGWG